VQPAGGTPWRVALGPAGCTVEPATDAQGASADAIVSGDASDLLLLLWNRTAPDPERTPVSGDAGVLDRWRRLPIFD
jgi:predicted lipid carrier protein YhbT